MAFQCLRKSVNLDIQNFGNTFCHLQREPSPASFIITDHVLSNLQFAGKFFLGQACLMPGSGEKVADSVRLHFLPEISFLYWNAVGPVGCAHAHLKFFTNPLYKLFHILPLKGYFNTGLFHECQHNTPLFLYFLSDKSNMLRTDK